MIHVFMVSKDKYAQIKFYLNEISFSKYINREIIYVYCKMNAINYFKIEGEPVIIPELRTELNFLSFYVSNNEKVICIKG